MKFRSYSEIFDVSEGELHEIQIAPLGKWRHNQYGTLDITDSDLADAVKEFEESKRTEIQMNYDHKEGKASGWIKRLVHKVGQGLFAMVKFTPTALELVKNMEYRYISPEWFQNYRDKINNKKWKMRIAGAALTNIPFFEGMQPVEVFSEQTLTLYAADEVDEAGENADTNKKIDRKEIVMEKLKNALSIEGEATEDAVLAKFEELQTEIAHLRSEVEQKEGRLQAKEDAIKEFKMQMTEIKDAMFSDKVDAVIDSAMSEGRLTKVTADKYRKLINESNFSEMSDLISELPKLEQFKEAGSSSSASETSSNAEFFKEVRKEQREQGISFREACDYVFKHKGDLFNEDANYTPIGDIDPQIFNK